MNGCLVFNILSLVCYCVVNYGMQQDARLKVRRRVEGHVCTLRSGGAGPQSDLVMMEQRLRGDCASAQPLHSHCTVTSQSFCSRCAISSQSLHTRQYSDALGCSAFNVSHL